MEVALTSIWNKRTYKPDEWITFEDVKPRPPGRPRLEPIYSDTKYITTSINLPVEIISQIDQRIKRGAFINRSDAIRYYIRCGLSNTD